MGQQRTGVDVHGVTAGGSYDGDPKLYQGIAEMRGGADAIAEVVVIDDFAQFLGDGLEIAPGQATVGRESLGEDQQIPAPLRQICIVERQPAADVRQAVLLGLMVMPSASEAISRTMSRKQYFYPGALLKPRGETPTRNSRTERPNPRGSTDSARAGA
jgi:hypothetical protein